LQPGLRPRPCPYSASKRTLAGFKEPTKWREPHRSKGRRGEGKGRGRKGEWKGNAKCHTGTCLSSLRALVTVELGSRPDSESLKIKTIN